MTKDEAKKFMRILEEDAKNVRSALMLTLAHDGDVKIEICGPPGNVQDFTLLEKVLSGFLMDLVLGRTEDPRKKKSPQVLDEMNQVLMN